MITKDRWNVKNLGLCRILGIKNRLQTAFNPFHRDATVQNCRVVLSKREMVAVRSILPIRLR
jgi:hypothetical protein